MDADRITLRGHHLGCTLVSIHNPSDHPTVPKAIEWLKVHPKGRVRVVIGPDDICLPCPHWDGTTCGRGFEELNKGKDARFITLLGMKPGEALPAAEVFARLCARADLAFFKDVCGTCGPDKCAQAAKAGYPLAGAGRQRSAGAAH